MVKFLLTPMISLQFQDILLEESSPSIELQQFQNVDN